MSVYSHLDYQISRQDRTISSQHYSHVVMAPRADVEEDAGSAGCAEAEGHNFLGQVQLRLAEILPFHAGCSSHRLGHKVIAYQSSCFEESAHICTTNIAYMLRIIAIYCFPQTRCDMPQMLLHIC